MADPETAAPEGTEQHPTVPERYRAPRYTTFEDVMPQPWLGNLGGWLQSQSHLFKRGGDAHGQDRFNYELLEIDDIFKPAADLKAAIASRLDQAVREVGVDDFDLEYIECHAALYHHGSHSAWHTDHTGYNGDEAPTRRLSWCLNMHAQDHGGKPMFSGGELEFLDGTMVAPENNRLVFFDPRQQHRIRRVECWSADFLHGRWALFGWIHGQPKGSTDHLSGKPLSG